MRNQVDFFVGHAINGSEKLPASLRHHDHTGGKLGQLLQQPLLIAVGLFENRVQRGHDRNSQIAQ